MLSERGRYALPHTHASDSGARQDNATSINGDAAPTTTPIMTAFTTRLARPLTRMTSNDLVERPTTITASGTDAAHDPSRSSRTRWTSCRSLSVLLVLLGSLDRSQPRLAALDPQLIARHERGRGL